MTKVSLYMHLLVAIAVCMQRPASPKGRMAFLWVLITACYYTVVINVNTKYQRDLSLLLLAKYFCSLSFAGLITSCISLKITRLILKRTKAVFPFSLFVFISGSTF